jgi:hypothetical protein
MPIAPPELLARRVRDTGLNILEGELLAEKASSLGHQSRKVETALARLRALDALGGDAEQRRSLVAQAAGDVWAYFVQRELCGWRDHRDVIRDLGIPREVLARLGAR